MTSSQTTKLRFGLIINPYAGVGGKVGLKGSDGDLIRQEAFARGAVAQAQQRTQYALEPLIPFKDKIEWLTVEGSMGADLLSQLNFNFQTSHHLSTESIEPNQSASTEKDTIQAAQKMEQQNLDLLIFAGGDGTARNIYQAIESRVPALGIPAGVKIHSGVFALTPLAASEILLNILKNNLVSIFEASVMDIDETAFRNGEVKAKQYGQMLIPAEHQYIQSTKVSSANRNHEDESLALMDIAEYLVDEMDEDNHYLIGSGTSCATLMDALDLPNTLLGIDWVHQEKLMGSDLNEADILNLLKEHPKKVKIIITVIGGQGHIIGRGNQQLSAQVLAQISREDLVVIASKTKLNQLDKRPLIVDSDDPEINKKYYGMIQIITGYDDRILYQVGF